MCEHGDTVDLRVYVHPRVAYLGVGRWDRKPIDRCIAPIVEALQARGIDMLGSCCGHGKKPGSILLADGRTLTIAPTERDSVPLRDDDRETAKQPDSGSYREDDL